MTVCLMHLQLPSVVGRVAMTMPDIILCDYITQLITPKLSTEFIKRLDFRSKVKTCLCSDRWIWSHFYYKSRENDKPDYLPKQPTDRPRQYSPVIYKSF